MSGFLEGDLVCRAGSFGVKEFKFIRLLCFVTRVIFSKVDTKNTRKEKERKSVGGGGGGGGGGELGKAMNS